MKKQKHFRAAMAIFMCFVLAILVWRRAEWSPAQTGCCLVMLLAGGVLLVNNQRNEAVRRGAFIPLMAACLALMWLPKPMDTRQIVDDLVLSLILVFVALKSYYPRWKNSRMHAESSSKPPAG